MTMALRPRRPKSTTTTKMTTSSRKALTHACSSTRFPACHRASHIRSWLLTAMNLKVTSRARPCTATSRRLCHRVSRRAPRRILTCSSQVKHTFRSHTRCAACAAARTSCQECSVGTSLPLHTRCTSFSSGSGLCRIPLSDSSLWAVAWHWTLSMRLARCRIGPTIAWPHVQSRREWTTVGHQKTYLPLVSSIYK